MSLIRRLITDLDFEEVIKKQLRIRVFQDNHMIDTNCHVVRFDDQIVVTQTGVGDIAYHRRSDCEFFEQKR